MSQNVPVPDRVSRGHIPRLTSLDGLRGIAAVAVVVYHALLASTLGDEFLDRLHGESGANTALDIVVDTPLRLLTMGPEAVVIFFVLSGFVLTLPMLGGKGLDLWAYYPRRIARLWIPAAASIALAIVLILLSTQNADDAVSEWGARYSFSLDRLTAHEVLKSLFFVTNFPGLNNPMWTLQWEMLFSLTLPVAFLFVARMRRGYVATIIGSAVVSGGGVVVDIPSLVYGPMFVAGCAAAKMIHDRGDRRTSPLASWGLFVCGLALISVPDILRVGFGWPVSTGAQGFVTLGATVLVLSLVLPSALTRFFGSAPMRFLGRISFSLYLVHVPVLLAAQHFAPRYPNLSLAVGAIASVAIAWGFARWVEEPSARIARRLGKRSSELRMSITAS
ncbi:acyltransferase family protein [Microbacterium sp. NPDC087868]|uniref:acyltransferase family protein n=1 Tax=Microbacterium sp. NPDC087868 TaxID=3364195 RepID=UPI00384D5918